MRIHRHVAEVHPAVKALRGQETRSAGLAPKPCGCPSTAEDGASCCRLRASGGLRCLCPCHGSAADVVTRERLAHVFHWEERS